MGILSGILSFFGKVKTAGKLGSIIPKAKQIEIAQLADELKLLEDGKTEFDLIGITSNGTDCIYFIIENGKFQIEFEALTSEQVPYLESLIVFAGQNEFETEMTTYGNKPHYKLEEAPVLRIITNSPLDKTAEIGQRIQKEIFNNADNTKYDVVP